jgi:ATP-dependent Clp protease ATP-binding subunit ClpC
MFEQFTDRARLVVVRSQDEARRLDHDHMGPDDVGGVGAKALEALRISLQAVRQQVEEITGRGEQAPSGRIPFTSEAKEVLGLAQQESRALGHHYVGTEHILLGLIRQGDTVPAQVLSGLGASLDGVREQVIRLLDEYRRGLGTG